MSYRYNSRFAQMGCDLGVCDNPAVGFAEVSLKHQGQGGIRDTLYLALCEQHILIGRPVERSWVDGAEAIA